MNSWILIWIADDVAPWVSVGILSILSGDFSVLSDNFSVLSFSCDGPDSSLFVIHKIYAFFKAWLDLIDVDGIDWESHFVVFVFV